MAGIAALMLIRSQAERKSVQDSLEISKNTNLAYSAKTRISHLLRENPSLILYSLSQWKEYLLNPSSKEAQDFIYPIRLCKSSLDWQPEQNKILEYAQAEQIQIGNSGFFRLINLAQVDKKKILVTIQAGTNKGSVSNLQGTLDYSLNYLQEKTTLPALWTKQKSRIRSEINGDLWSNNCDFDISRVRFYKKGYKAKYVPFSFPYLPDLYKIIYRIPASHTIRLDNNYSGETIFPRSKDSPTRIIEGYQVYEYVLEDFDSDSEIEIQTFVDGKPVMVILNAKKGVDKGSIKHTCGGLEDCPAQNLVIINHTNNENDKMCFKTDKLEAFIFSPFSGVGFIKESENIKRPKVIGSIWTKGLIDDRVCGKDIEIQASLTLENIIRDFQIINSYPQITGFSEFKPVDSKIIDNQLDIRNQDRLLPDFTLDSLPVFIDEEFNPENP